MAENNSSEIVARAASVMPVIEGALAFIVISFVGVTWPSIPHDKAHDAFTLVYASGAHFLFSFLLVTPMMLIATSTRSAGLHIGMVLGLFAYVFWSLNEQHRALSNLFLPGPWALPLPGCEAISAAMRAVTGSSEVALYFSPFLLGVAVAIITGMPLMLVMRPKASPAPRARR